MIKKIKWTGFLVSMILPITMALSQEKVGTTLFQFLKVTPFARSNSMGEAAVTSFGYSETLFHNPAGISSIERLDLSFTFYQYFFDIQTMAFTGALKLGNIGVIGLMVLYNDIGEMEVTSVDRLSFIGDTYNPGLTGGTFSPSNLAIGLSYARQITEKFSFGITAKFVRDDMDFNNPFAASGRNKNIEASNVLFDGGLIYHTGYKSVAIAVALRHFGSDIQYIDKGFPPPQSLSTGISAYILSPENSLLFHSENQRLLLEFDMFAPRDYDQQYNMGLEYSIFDKIFLRAGYKANYDTEGLCLGFGFKLGKYRGDYSYNNYAIFYQDVHRFSVGVCF